MGAVFIELIFSDAIAVVEIDPFDVFLHFGEESGYGFCIFNDGLFGTFDYFVCIFLHLLSITEVVFVEEIQFSYHLIDYIDF